MKQSCVSAFARGARVVVLAAVLAGLGAGGLLAQATGKIEGRVRDQAGAPIANAQVFIVGTAFNALTTPQGYYFINNVPASTVTVRAAFVGYRPVQFTDVKVLAGQTLTQDFALEQSPVELEVVTIEAENPLVPRDEVTSKQRVDGDFTEALPVDRINNVLALQPGVVASASGNTLSIRGGRTDEAVTYVDGVPVTGGLRGTQQFGTPGTTVSIPTQGFEEASVTTGSSSAEFGNAQSGIVNVQTRAGGTDYSGSIAYETDEVSGTKHGLGFNRIEASFGGPLPIGLSGLTFFASGVLEGQQSFPGLTSNGFGFDAIDNPIFVQAGVDTTVVVPYQDGAPTVGGTDTTFVDVHNYAIYRGECDAALALDNNGNPAISRNPEIADNYGRECQGIRLPSSGSSTSQLQAKLQYSYGTGSRLALTLLRSQNQNRVFSYVNLYNPQQLRANLAWNNVATLNWTQNLSKSAERALALETYFSYQQDRTMLGPLNRQAEIDSRDPFGGFFFLTPSDFRFNFQNFPVDEALVENYRANVPGTRRSPYTPEDESQFLLVNQYRNNAYGILGGQTTTPGFGNGTFSESGGPVGTIRLYREERAIGKANLDWQLDRYNRMKLGGEFTRYKLTNYAVTLGQALFVSDAYIEKPIRYNMFVEDRLDLGDVVVVGGVRYDYFDSRAARPFNLDTITNSPTFGQYVRFPRLSSYPGTFNGQPLAVLREDESHDYISPHIQVSFPVTDRTNFRLSYAHQVQAPDFGVVLSGINTDLTFTNTNQLFGEDLDFGKTITFEFGIRHAFSDDMVLDLAAYNKDNLANAAGRLLDVFDPQTATPRTIRFMRNADFGNVRGLDVRLDRRFGNLFNGALSYSFQQAKNTGDDPNTYINFGSRVISSLGGNPPPPQAILPTAFSRPHNLAGSVALTFPGDWKEGTTIGSILQDVGAFATFRYSSGFAYTVCEAGVGDNDVVSGDNCENNFPEPFNSSRLPAFKQFDLRVSKGFGFGGVNLTAYADIRNLLNFKNILTVFTTSKDVVSQEDQDVAISQELVSYQNEANRNGVLDDATGEIDLRFGGAVASGCSSWQAANGTPSAPNCVALIRAEERFGNGDHILNEVEQERAALSFYNADRLFANLTSGGGLNNFTGQPRRVRLGVEINF